MATTSIHEVRDIARTINYICNKNKTLNGQLIATINCEKGTAIDDFKLTNLAGQELHKSRPGKDAVVIYQSFSPNDPVTPEEALEIGLDFAKEFTNEEHEVVIATHIDQAHIHNHIVIGMRNIHDFKKMRIQKNTHLKIREISDRLCMEHGLSVLLTHGMSKTLNYNDYFNIISTSYRDEIKNLIDLTIPTAESIEDIVKMFELNGAEVKRGKHLAVKLAGQKRFIRLKSLGNLYTEDSIKERIKIETGKANDSYKIIPIAKSLIQEMTEDEIILRIPFTRQQLHVPKKDITWKNSGMLNAKLFFEHSYYVDGQVKLGQDFSEKFATVKESEQFYLNEFRGILKNNDIDIETLTLRRHSKRQFVETVKRLNRIIELANDHSISKKLKVSFKDKVDEVNQEIKKINSRIENFKKDRVGLSKLFRDVLLLEKYPELLPGDFVTTSIEKKLVSARTNLIQAGYTMDVSSLNQVKQDLKKQQQTLIELEKEIIVLKNKKIGLSQLKKEIKELVHQTENDRTRTRNQTRKQEIRQILGR